jgi:hypothetical protein
MTEQKSMNTKVQRHYKAFNVTVFITKILDSWAGQQRPNKAIMRYSNVNHFIVESMILNTRRKMLMCNTMTKGVSGILRQRRQPCTAFGTSKIPYMKPELSPKYMLIGSFSIATCSTPTYAAAKVTFVQF